MDRATPGSWANTGEAKKSQIETGLYTSDGPPWVRISSSGSAASFGIRGEFRDPRRVSGPPCQKCEARSFGALSSCYPKFFGDFAELSGGWVSTFQAPLTRVVCILPQRTISIIQEEKRLESTLDATANQLFLLGQSKSRAARGFWEYWQKSSVRRTGPTPLLTRVYKRGRERNLREEEESFTDPNRVELVPRPDDKPSHFPIQENFDKRDSLQREKVSKRNNFPCYLT
jgi:hypothetical protein